MGPTAVDDDPSLARAGRELDTTTSVEADGDASILRVTKVAVGPLTDEEAKGISTYGDLRHFEEPLRAWIEKG